MTPTNPIVMERNQHRIKRLIRTAHEVKPGEGRVIEQARSGATQDALMQSDVRDRVLIKHSADRMDDIPKAQAVELMAAIGTLLGDVLGNDPAKHGALDAYIRNRQRRRVKAQQRRERDARIVQDARNAGH